MVGIPNKWLRKVKLLFRWRRLCTSSVIKREKTKQRSTIMAIEPNSKWTSSFSDKKVLKLVRCTFNMKLKLISGTYVYFYMGNFVYLHHLWVKWCSTLNKSSIEHRSLKSESHKIFCNRDFALVPYILDHGESKNVVWIHTIEVRTYF